VSVFHQMGHDSRNLVFEQCLSNYSGVILSPLNDDQSSMIQFLSDVKKHKNIDEFETIFDPQLFFPKSEKDTLNDWGYFPCDTSSEDHTQLSWWRTLNTNLVESIVPLNISGLCSPVRVPRVYSDDYYSLCVDICDDLCAKLDDVEILQTLFVDYDDLSSENRAKEISSIISKTQAERCYLILHSNVTPRRELVDEKSLRGALDLIYLLEQCNLKVLVGYSSSDFILWKYAGASSIATGKFFNLRRFSPSRWEESTSSGGGQLAYWFEPSLLAFLREADLDRLLSKSIIPPESQISSPASEILLFKNDRPGVSWLGRSWRLYLNWYQSFDKNYSTPMLEADNYLADCEKAWATIENEGILMEERQNDGSWLRKWRQAIRTSLRWTS